MSLQTAPPVLSLAPRGAGDDLAAARAQIVQAGARAAARGWVPATAGNFSVRAGAAHIAITRTGTDKSRLGADDVLLQPLHDAPLRGTSAETALHQRLYTTRAAVGAVFHTHSRAATVLSRLVHGTLWLEGWELQKALEGVSTHEQRVALPVLQNTQDIAALAALVEERLAATDDAATDTIGAPGVLIAGHGLYAWGRDATQAWRHLEALEALIDQHLLLSLHTR